MVNFSRSMDLLLGDYSRGIERVKKYGTWIKVVPDFGCRLNTTSGTFLPERLGRSAHDLDDSDIAGNHGIITQFEADGAKKGTLMFHKKTRALRRRRRRRPRVKMTMRMRKRTATRKRKAARRTRRKKYCGTVGMGFRACCQKCLLFRSGIVHVVTNVSNPQGKCIYSA